MGPYSGSGYHVAHVTTSLPRGREPTGFLAPGTPSKSVSILRRPPPERDWALGGRDTGRVSLHRCLTWCLFLGTVLAAGMGGYALGAARSAAEPRGAAGEGRDFEAAGLPTGRGALRLPRMAAATTAGDGGGAGGAAFGASGPERRSLSQYDMRRAATGQIPGRPPGSKPPAPQRAAAAAAALTLPPCVPPGSGSEGCGATLGQPRVALMFLTTGDMPHDALWRAWLQAADGLVRADCLDAVSDAGTQILRAGWNTGHAGAPAGARLLPLRIGSACTETGGGRGDTMDIVARQTLFSVYVHSPPDHGGYPEGSTFRGHVIGKRTKTDWGDHSLVEATQLLIQAALEEPLNQRFVLLSESCVPLYSAPATYLQLMGRPKSRINACDGPDSDLNRERWRTLLGEGGLDVRHWRKSAQWFAVTRRHAEMVAADTRVIAAFGKLCENEKAEQGRAFLNCHSDENYLPSLLALQAADNETDCTGAVTAAEWMVSKYGDAYPRFFLPQEISGDFLEHLRAAEDVCDVAGANAAVSATFLRIGGSGHGGVGEGEAHPCGPQAVEAGGTLGGALSYQCPLFARKFSSYTANPLLGLFQQDRGLGILHGFCTGRESDS